MNKTAVILGASCFFKDAYKEIRYMGYRIVSIDYSDDKKAVCRKYADKVYKTSTLDYDKVLNIARTEKADVIYAGASEANIPVAIRLSQELGLDYYCGLDQWKIGTNKKLFKQMCQRHGLDVTEYYLLNRGDIDSDCRVPFPVVTKPIDSAGSAGVSICHDAEEFRKGVAGAFGQTNSSEILVEKYIPFDSVIVHYTLIHGKAYFCGMSDKKSRKISSAGGPVMSAQLFPSELQGKFLAGLDETVREMYEQEGFKNGPVWIEVFSDGDKFLFNEMGHRFGGSMTYLPVKFYHGIDQIELLADCSRNIEDSYLKTCINSDKKYAIIPIHISAGKIKVICGLEECRKFPGIHAIELCHVTDDDIKSSGTVGQVFCYLHIVSDSVQGINSALKQVKARLSVKSYDGTEMLMDESVSV